MSEQAQKPYPETLEVFYDLTKDALNWQIESGRALDSKMVQIFSVASVVAGLAGFSTASAPINRADWSVAVLLIAGFGAYAATAYVAFQHLRPRRWKRINYPAFWKEGWRLGPSQLQHSIVAKVAKNFDENQVKLEEKANTIRLALVTTGAEVVLIGLALIAGLVS